MGRTCDECRFYDLGSGVCNRFHIMRHSCGEDACPDFELADDLAKMGVEEAI